MTTTTTPDAPAVRSAGLFRRQAIEHRAGQRVEGELLRLPRGLVAWPGRLLYAMLAAALFAVCLLDLPRTASGPALLVPDGPGQDQATLWFALPGTTGADVAPGTILELVIAGGAPLRATVEVLGAAALPAEDRCWLESRAAESFAAAPVVGRARVHAPGRRWDAGRSTGQARLAVGNDRAVFALFPDLDRLRPRGAR